MVGAKFQSKPRFNVRSVRLKNKLNGDLIQGTLVNEEDIDGNKYFVIRFDNGNINKFNKEAFTLVGSSSR